MAGAPSSRPGTINQPRVTGPMAGITQSRFYRAETRLPQPNLPGAMGRPTEANLRVSVGSGGVLASYIGPSGLRQFYVNMVATPPEV